MVFHLGSVGRLMLPDHTTVYGEGPPITELTDIVLTRCQRKWVRSAHNNTVNIQEIGMTASSQPVVTWETI